MGFTPWMYEATLDAMDVTYTRLIQHGDIIKHHIMGGIPWQEALDQTAYPQNIEDDLNGKINRTPNSTVVFLAIDSLNTERNFLTPNWNAQGDNQPLTGDWLNRSWNSPEVITAYINFASDLIDRFQPRYFEYGTEFTELIINDPAAYPDYVEFAQAVYTQLKASYPNLELMTSVALKSPGSTEMQQIAAQIVQVLPYTDVLGISVYPYAFYEHADRGDPANMPGNWLSQVSQFSQGKPLAISETGWIAEDLQIVFPQFTYAESSNVTKQNSFASMLLTAANSMNMKLVIWWTVTDFDTLWNNELGQDPVAKIWKDIGLYNQDQIARAGLHTWDEWLSRQVYQN